MRVLLAGGGTAGHVEPALATADALRRLDPDCELALLGTERGLETRLVPARGYPLELIDPVPLPRRMSPDLARVPTRLRRAVRQAGEVIDRMNADVVVGFGGYVALPAYLAVRRRRLPLVIHEANARPGLANRVGARFATAIAVATPVPSLPRAVHIGMPLRHSVSSLDRAAARPGARQTWGFDERPVLFVFGGSQGARRLNEAVVGAAPRLVASGVQVLHATGLNNHDDVLAALKDAGVSDGYVAVPYVDDMPSAYAAADLALCRAGAMTVAEVSAVGLPAIFVPLPIGNGEQRFNAEPVVAAGGGVLVADDLMTSAALLDTAVPLLTDQVRLDAMATAAAGFGRTDANTVLAGMVRDAAAGRR
ncbi:MAG TPA: undecaprenyldiphospho-muramoylpentapeptide beta-N-acetylglucosaminyltransferase [Gaiellales bacterium]|nr:undecaprenyldiphospho-muramoylpentapeptide beta-N-acetylglucosaminyltransferase [Gaiellales bacterium]